MDADLDVLIAGVSVAAALLVMAFAVLRRGQLEAQAMRDAALRRASNDAAAQQRVLDELDKHLGPLRRDIAAREKQVDAQLAAMQALLNENDQSTGLGAIWHYLHNIHLTIESLQERVSGAPAAVDYIEHEGEAEQISSHDEPRPDLASLTGPQVQALAQVYWELEAVASAVQQKLSALPDQDDTMLPPDFALQLRSLPVLPIEPMRNDVELMGGNSVLIFNSISSTMDRLHADTGPASAGHLRRLMIALAEDIRCLLTQLEEVTAAHEA